MFWIKLHEFFLYKIFQTLTFLLYKILSYLSISLLPYQSIYLYIVSNYLFLLLFVVYNLTIFQSNNLSIKPFSPLFILYIILFYLPLLWTIRPCFKVTFVVHPMDGSYALNLYLFSFLDISEKTDDRVWFLSIIGIKMYFWQ